MKQIGITHNREMLPSSWDSNDRQEEMRKQMEQDFYDDVGLIYIDTEGVIKHLIKGEEDYEETRPETEWKGPEPSWQENV